MNHRGKVTYTTCTQKKCHIISLRAHKKKHRLTVEAYIEEEKNMDSSLVSQVKQAHLKRFPHAPRKNKIRSAHRIDRMPPRALCPGSRVYKRRWLDTPYRRSHPDDKRKSHRASSSLARRVLPVSDAALMRVIKNSGKSRVQCLANHETSLAYIS